MIYRDNLKVDGIEFKPLRSKKALLDIKQNMVLTGITEIKRGYIERYGDTVMLYYLVSRSGTTIYINADF